MEAKCYADRRSGQSCLQITMCLDNSVARLGGINHLEPILNTRHLLERIRCVGMYMLIITSRYDPQIDV